MMVLANMYIPFSLLRQGILQAKKNIPEISELVHFSSKNICDTFCFFQTVERFDN